MSWTVYIVECKDGSLYTGITTDVTRRIHEHNTSPKGAKYTQYRRPVKLVYNESCEDRSSAGKREWQIKRLSRGNKLKLIKG